MIMKKYQTTIKVVGGKWYIDKINSKLPPIKISLLIKKEQIKEYKIKENHSKAKYHWDDYKFQLNCNNLEWVDPNT